MEDICIKEKSVSVSGVTAVVSIDEKEAEILRASGRVTILGTNLQAQKLALEQGLLVLTADSVTSVKFGAPPKKFSLKNIFK